MSSTDKNKDKRRLSKSLPNTPSGDFHNGENIFESDATKLQKDKEKRDRLKNRLKVKIFIKI